jgi:hypothetical protein
MKPVSVINRGDNFVTLRATTDRPAEIQEALEARDVQHVFKGDQNQAWDAVLANHCLARAVGDSGTEITFFVQDERLGTSDARLARLWRRDGRHFVLTEDYFRGRAGAVWEHQDASYGLFFTEAVDPEQFARASVHLHRAAVLWERHSSTALADGEWIEALGALGVAFPGAGALGAAGATRLGGLVDRDTLVEFFGEHPVAALYYAFTKTDGLYGVVPVENDNVTLSSIPASDPELRSGAGRLLLQSARGAMRLAGSKAHRRGIKQRARRVAEWAAGFLEANPQAGVADFQVALGQWLTREVFPADRIELDRTSRFTRVSPGASHARRRPSETMQFFFDLALRHPREFSEAYNEALNHVGFGLQRVKYEPLTGRYTPPFFVEFAADPAQEPIYRWNIELSGVRNTTIRLDNASAGEIVLEAEDTIRSAADFIRALFDHFGTGRSFSIVGKAATFAAELQRAPRGLGLPRQGSKYAPMVDHLVAGLRARGILDQPTGLLIRIGLNALDRLDSMGETPLRMPCFLEGALGRTATCREVASRWRDVAAEARALLEMLSHCPFGQHVHLVKAISLNARGGDWDAALASDSRLAGLARGLQAHPGGPGLLRSLGRDVPPQAAACMERLTARREALLEARRGLFDEARAAREGGRFQPDPGALGKIQEERERVECRLLLLFAAYVRRLWQRAESLPYLNDRPYTLALYLLFGRDIFPPICREVEFDIEYLSLCLDACGVAEACPAAVG